MTAPHPRATVIGSISLFVVLFILLTIQLSASTSSAGASHRKAKPAIVRSQGAQTDAAPEPGEATAEPVEPEYVEPEYTEVEPEPEYEEAPPVVTTSS
ncbi:MAG TPA: hypothetical protein VFS26_09350 [Solirubrobacterales bacterium]|nr:hypothetical protein [Solirubrobacterales bacterium]